MGTKNQLRNTRPPTVLRVHEPEFDRHGHVTLASELVFDKNRSHRFFFRLAESDYHPSMLERASAHLFAMIMPAMRVGAPLHVEGKLEKCLAYRMDAFMRYWNRWCPDRFHQILITADEWLVEKTDTSAKEGAISCFSGGVDSFYSLQRFEQDTGHRVKSLLFIHGLDIGLEQKEGYRKNADQMEEWLSNRSQRLLRVQMNARDTARRFHLNWGSIGHGVFLAAGLHLFSHDHLIGCIPSSHSPDSPIVPWGSNPVTDPLFSISRFPIIHHDYQVPRFEKISALVKRHDCLKHIRVCWKQNDGMGNCGFCEKCIPSLLAFETTEKDSWRTVFPEVQMLSDVFFVLPRLRLNRFQIEQLEIVRQHANILNRDDIVSQLDQVLPKKTSEKITLTTLLRRSFYRWKCALSLRKPQSPVGE